MRGTPLPLLMVEFDLAGKPVTLTDSDARLLLTAAEAGAGASIGSRDLATRLKPLIAPVATTRRRRLVFTRPESRALQRIIQTQIEPTNELQNLRATLVELLAPQS
jgi:hypothetical protein